MNDILQNLQLKIFIIFAKKNKPYEFYLNNYLDKSSAVVLPYDISYLNRIANSYLIY